MTKTRVIKPDFSDLSSRNLGAQYRKETILALQRGERIVFNLAHVDGVSHSFADELFGVLGRIVGSRSATKLCASGRIK